MNYVDLANELFDAARNNVVMEREGAHGAEHFVRNAKLAAREGGFDAYAVRHRALQRAGKNKEIGTGGGQAVHLLPCGVANSVRAQLVWKAIQDAQFVANARHAE